MSVDMKDVVVRYFTHPNTGKGVACVAAVKTPDGIKIGWSQCNKKDVFNRKAARAIAIQRALFPPKEPIKPASLRLKMYRPGETPFQPPTVQTIVVSDPIESLKEIVESVAKRAFAPKVVGCPTCGAPNDNGSFCSDQCELSAPPNPADKFEAQADQMVFPAEGVVSVVDELPEGLIFDEYKKTIIDVATGEIVARRINDEYVPA